MASGWGLFALGFPSCHYPASIPVIPNMPTMPSADFCHTVKFDCSHLSHAISRKRLAMAVWQTSRGKTRNCRCVNAGFIKQHPNVDGGLRGHVPTRPGCPTPRIRFLFVAPHLRIGLPPGPPRDGTLALLLTLGSANTWYRDLHPISYVPCPAHTRASAAEPHRTRVETKNERPICHKTC